MSQLSSVPGLTLDFVSFTSALALVISSYNKVLNIIINIMGDYQFIFLVWISHLNAGLIHQLLNISIWVSDTRFNLTFSKPNFLSFSLPTPSQLMATLSFHLLLPKPWSQRYIFYCPHTPYLIHKQILLVLPQNKSRSSLLLSFSTSTTLSNHHHLSPGLSQWPPNWFFCFQPLFHLVYSQHNSQSNPVKMWVGSHHAAAQNSIMVSQSA